jgi:hypothetical protein
MAVCAIPVMVIVSVLSFRSSGLDCRRGAIESEHFGKLKKADPMKGQPLEITAKSDSV